jgi:hypothetical protein
MLRHLAGFVLCVAAVALPETLHANPICRPHVLGGTMIDAFGRPCLLVQHGPASGLRGHVPLGRINLPHVPRGAVEPPRFGFTTGPSGPFTTGSLNSTTIVPHAQPPHRR